MTEMRISVGGPSRAQPPRFSGQLPPLLGRDTDLLTLVAHLCRSDAYLSTLTGPGGVGKSRLAAAAADEVTLTTSFTVVLADLHDVDTAEGVLRSAAGALGDEFGRTIRAPVTVRDIVAIIPDRDVLLILDGCEQVIEAVAALVSDLRSWRSRLRVLTTGRRPLKLYGERLFPLRPLPTPQCPLTEDVAELPEYPSVALFMDRARAMDPSFALTAENAEPVAEICRRMDGLPLAIELTAARLRLFPVATLVNRLQESGHGAVGRNTGRPHRHRSLHALTEGSFRLLDEEQQRLLMRIAVCVQDIGLDTVEDLGGLAPHQTERVLEPLVDLNLVVVRHGSGAPRFAVLETVRMFCLDRLTERGELADVKTRHAEHFQALAHRAKPHLTGGDQAQWLGELEAAHDNLRCALDFLVQDERPAEASSTAVAMHRFWLIHGHLEIGCRHLTDASLSQSDGAAQAAYGALAAAMGDVLRAAEAFHRASTAYRECGDHDREQAMLAQRHAALQHAGERPNVRSIDHVIRSAGRAEAPTEIGDAALALAMSAGQDLDRCEELLGVARLVYARHQDVRGTGLVFAEQAELAMARGQFDVAERLFRLSMERLRSVGERTMLPTVLDAYASLLWQQVSGQEDRTVRMMAAGSALRKATHASPLRTRRTVHAGPLRQLRRNLGGARFEALWQEGRLLDSAAMVAEILSAPLLADGGRTPSAPQEAKLTPRQYQIASLVSQGLTNRQIAHQLQISEWTAVNHVRQIMQKLGLPSRIHVAQWVLKVDDGLGDVRRGEHGQ
ncbi:non-specific serine/threonine protein kinase [Kibdelosporangium banguiense]|uniref:Non-specific serine/threonine protein kinase n=1 Tax=Kibdelosporangium banguiense TaxID=1365924 RepID=A0ABS4TRX0_9PSEU|nr:LuxR C-terminal-related transcriptional regulator [Kibdelosporangium banguiense]MBP2327149.1 non-specific serine/threonine protein kinase [Kibdelosporangium banguiense]